MNKVAIVSPSGNFYGSEQVLFDFLQHCSGTYDVYVPSGSKLYNKLKCQSIHSVIGFNSIVLLYTKLLFLLIFKYKTLYVNEGGHIRYVKLLASFFFWKNFVVHLRILEDTYCSRLKGLGKNVKLIVVSNFIKEKVDTTHNVMKIYDSFDNSTIVPKTSFSFKNKFRIGIVGRVTPTKGLSDMMHFVNFLENERCLFEIHFFGHQEVHIPMVKEFVEKSKKNRFCKCLFHGFVDSQDAIYNSIDITLHFNTVEALGRIFFESWSYGVPLFGFDEGGIGELSNLLSFESFVVSKKDGWEKVLMNRINESTNLLDNKSIDEIRSEINKLFNVSKYCKEIEDTFRV